MRPGGEGDGGINRAGFREREADPARTPGTFRVVVLGDSTTWGLRVSRAERWPDQLSVRLAARSSRPVEVFDFAVPASDIEQIATLAEQLLPVWQPDLVIYGCFWNDPSPTLVTRMGAFPAWVGDGPPPFTTLGPGPDAWLRPRSALFRRIEGAAAAARFPDKEAPLDWEFFDAQVARLLAACREAGAALTVLTIPAHVLSLDGPDCDVRAGQWPDFCAQNKQAVQRIGEWFAAHDVPVVSGKAAYQTPPRQSFFITPDNPSHPDAAGHARLAVAVDARIQIP